MKGFGGNTLGLVPAVVLTLKSLFNVLKICAEIKTLNIWPFT